MPLDPTDQRRQVYGHEAYAPGVGPNANRPVKKPSSKPPVDVTATRTDRPSNEELFSLQNKAQNSGSAKGLEVEHQEGPHVCPADVKDEPHAVPPEEGPHDCPAGVKEKDEPNSVNPPAPASDNPYAFNPGISEHVKETDGTYGSSGVNNTKPDDKTLASKKEAREICDDFYRAVDGLGTDDKLFEKTLSRLNADNIMEVMSNWDETYGEDYKERFIDSFLGDADPSQKKEFGLKIVQALEERADKLGEDEYYTKMATNAKISLNKSMLNPIANNEASYYINTLYNILKIKER